MSDALRLLALLAVAASAVRAQPAPGRALPARTLLARAEALQAALAQGDSATRARESVRRRATPFSAGSLTVVLPALVDDAVGRRIATGAAALLEDAGAVPERFVGSLLVVSDFAVAVDSAARASGLGARARVALDAGLRPDTLTDDWKVATAVGRVYVNTRDPTWRFWLPWNVGVGWKMSRDGRAAVQDLMAGETRAGARCLAGEPDACRLWLGLDRDVNPYAVRYTPAELRRMLSQRWFYGGGGPAVKECLEGTDDACVRAVESGGVLPSIPAGYEARGSLLRVVRLLHGTPSLQRALADTAGSVGERLARATGVGPDSLVAEWRAWLLTAGGRARVRADAHEAVPVVLFGALLLVAAAGSGRWR